MRKKSASLLRLAGSLGMATMLGGCFVVNRVGMEFVYRKNHRWCARYVCEGFCGFSADYFVSRFARVKPFLGQGLFYFSHQATKAS